MKGYFCRSLCRCIQSVLTDTWINFFIVIKLTTDDRQNEPINHRLRAGQESSNFVLPMKAVRLLWTQVIKSCPLFSPIIYKRTLLSVRGEVWIKQPSRRKGGLNSLTSFRTPFLWYLLPTGLPSMSSWSPSACRSNPTVLWEVREETLFLKLSSSWQVTLCHSPPGACSEGIELELIS